MQSPKGFSDRFSAGPVDVVQSVANYTRFVLFSKWTLMLLSVGMIGTVIVLPLITADHDELRLAFSEIGESDQTIPVMNNPKLQGVDKFNQPYTITADEALQPDEDTIILKGLEADFFDEDKSWLALDAKQGTLNNKQEQLLLAGNVNLYHDKGYEAHTEEAHINMKNNDVYGTQPIKLQGMLGVLTADAFRIEDKAQLMHFTGNVRMEISFNE